MKTPLLIALTGALVGIVAASFVVPPVLSWYTTPGGLPQGAAQAVVQVPEIVRYVTSRLIIGQAIGAVIGAALGLTMWFLWRRDPSRGNPRPDAATPPSR